MIFRKGIDKLLSHLDILYLKIKYPKQLEIGKNFKIDHLYINMDGTSKIIIGDNVRIKGRIRILCRNNGFLSIGDNSSINDGCSINVFGRTTIGANCRIGENVKFYDMNHKFRDISELIKSQGYKIGEIIIEENTWIGTSSVILRGAHLKSGSVLSAGSIISHNRVAQGHIIDPKQVFN
jgi:acetyltransferase-like isoleucine patch superfamily enzyme